MSSLSIVVLSFFLKCVIYRFRHRYLVFDFDCHIDFYLQRWLFLRVHILHRTIFQYLLTSLSATPSVSLFTRFPCWTWTVSFEFLSHSSNPPKEIFGSGTAPLGFRRYFTRTLRSGECLPSRRLFGFRPSRLKDNRSAHCCILLHHLSGHATAVIDVKLSVQAERSTGELWNNRLPPRPIRFDDLHSCMWADFLKAKGIWIVSANGVKFKFRHSLFRLSFFVVYKPSTVTLRIAPPDGGTEECRPEVTRLFFFL